MGRQGVVVGNLISNALEDLHNCMLIRSDGHSTLPKHLEASFYQLNTLKQAGFTFSTESIRDDYLADIMSRGQQETLDHKKLLG